MNNVWGLARYVLVVLMVSSTSFALSVGQNFGNPDPELECGLKISKITESYITVQTINNPSTGLECTDKASFAFFCKGSSCYTEKSYMDIPPGFNYRIQLSILSGTELTWTAEVLPGGCKYAGMDGLEQYCQKVGFQSPRRFIYENSEATISPTRFGSSMMNGESSCQESLNASFRASVNKCKAYGYKACNEVHSRIIQASNCTTLSIVEGSN